MPTQSTTYNTRLTDETLEKRFRDTFRSQGGAELVDDLYASGVIVPVVDFTAAAEGSSLRSDLQIAWDFSTGTTVVNGASNVTIISTPGFWQVDLNYAGNPINVLSQAKLDIYDGSTAKIVWRITEPAAGTNTGGFIAENRFVVFLRSGDVLRGSCANSGRALDVWYRQIATVNGDFVNPLGFTSS